MRSFWLPRCCLAGLPLAGKTLPYLALQVPPVEFASAKGGQLQQDACSHLGRCRCYKQMVSTPFLRGLRVQCMSLGQCLGLPNFALGIGDSGGPNLALLTHLCCSLHGLPLRR